MRKRFLLAGLIFVVLVGSVFGAVSYKDSAHKETGNKVRYVGFKVYDPVYVAQDKGFFKKNGVDVEIASTVAAGPTGIQTVAGGSAEACLSSYMAIINARAAGLPVTAVSDIQSAIGDQALEEFFVRNDSGIKSIQDLKGKRIAVNLMKSSFHYTLLMALDNAGIKADEVEWVLLPFDQQELALENNKVDLIGLMPPYVEHAKENKEFTKLFNALDVFGEKQFCTHLVNDVWAKYNPETAEGFVTAIAEAINWIENNQEEAKEIVSKYTGIDSKYITDYHFQENGQVVTKDAQYWLDYMIKTKEIGVTWLKVDDFATNKYNKLLK